MADLHGFTIWLRGECSAETFQHASELLATAVREHGMRMERIDAARLARDAYREHDGAFGLAIPLAANRLNRNGVAVLVHGARGPLAGVNWGPERPGRMLEVSCEEIEVAGDEAPFRFVIDVPSRESVPPKAGTPGPVIAVLAGLGWLPDEGRSGDAAGEEDAEIRRRLEQLGYL